MKYIALMLLIISFVLLATGCSKSYGEWKEDAQKVIENNLNSTYQTYIVDPESYMEVEGEYGRRYSLSNEEVSPQSVGAQIGSVSVSGQASAVIVIDEVTNTPVPRDELSAIEIRPGQYSEQQRKVLRYGQVCVIEGIAKEDSIAVEINDILYQAIFVNE